MFSGNDVIMSHAGWTRFHWLKFLFALKCVGVSVLQNHKKERLFSITNLMHNSFIL